MGEETSEEKSICLPGGCYIEIVSAPNPDSQKYYCNSFGDSIINLYRSLDWHKGSPSVEHVAKMGSFRIGCLKEKTAEQFFQEVREGIDKLLAEGTYQL